MALVGIHHFVVVVDTVVVVVVVEEYMDKLDNYPFYLVLHTP